MVWDYGITAPTHLILEFTAASAKGDQGLSIALLVLEEHGTGCRLVSLDAHPKGKHLCATPAI